MSIAKKMLSCCKLAAIPPTPATRILYDMIGENGQPPMPVVGFENESMNVLLNNGKAMLENGYIQCYPYKFSQPHGDQDFLLDFFYDGSVLPDIMTSGGYGPFVCWSNSLYLMTSGHDWNYGLPIPSTLAGSLNNHLAFGRQAGVVQVWLNGHRIFAQADSRFAPYSDPNSPYCFGKKISQTEGVYCGIAGIRYVVGRDVYGDSPEITIPSLPLQMIP